jgi:hypothetical protein
LVCVWAVLIFSFLSVSFFLHCGRSVATFGGRQPLILTYPEWFATCNMSVILNR